MCQNMCHYQLLDLRFDKSADLSDTVDLSKVVYRDILTSDLEPTMFQIPIKFCVSKQNFLI